MSSGWIRGRRLAGFFIVAAFATSRGPSADESEVVTALGEHDRQEPVRLREPQENGAAFGRGMARVVHDQAEGIAEGGGRLVGHS